MEKDEKNLLEASAILFFLNISASALNYLCQLVTARVLSVESYGTVNTIFAFMTIIAVPGTALTMVVTKYYASEGNNHSYGYLRKQIKIVWLMTIVVFTLLLGLKPYLREILDIEDTFVLMVTVLLAAIGFFQPLYAGVLSGNKRFVLVGVYSLFIPVYKLIAIVASRFVSNVDKERLYYLLVFMLVGTVITALYGNAKAKTIIKKTQDDIYIGKIYTKADFNTLIMNLSLMLYMNIDLLSVRYYGSERESGLYSAVLLFGRIIYYFATTLGTILLPTVADKNITEQQTRKTLNKTMIIMIVFSVILMLPINIWKGQLINILYGDNYISAEKYVIYVSFISVALSLYTIMINYMVGIGKTKKATLIMLMVDFLLVLCVFLIKNLLIILTLIAIIGTIGVIAIYCLTKRG